MEHQIARVKLVEGFFSTNKSFDITEDTLLGAIQYGQGAVVELHKEQLELLLGSVDAGEHDVSQREDKAFVDELRKTLGR